MTEKAVEIMHEKASELPEYSETTRPNTYYISGFRRGYEQAEKELALTWEDIPKILFICENLKTSWWFMDNEQTKLIGKQPFFEEVLRRFLEQKGNKL